MASKRRKRRPKKGTKLQLRRTGGWGGARRGAGRKPADPKARSRVPHVKRPLHRGRHPVHVTLRAMTGLPSFRQQRVHRLLAGVIRDQRRRRYRDTFRVLHWSIQSNHLHLIIEADTEKAEGYVAIRSGISGLEIAFARRLNRPLNRSGKVWADRYHRHDLKSPREARAGFTYVLRNNERHGIPSRGAGLIDLYSSACRFHGWAQLHFVPPETEHWFWPTCPPQTWLASVGVLRDGPLTFVRPR